MMAARAASLQLNDLAKSSTARPVPSVSATATEQTYVHVERF